ncbi:MAG: hypothetical protein JW727_02835 [Candidatus Aenigmarchaeota archaeon]|nr:hypothetical protein [Candidatus Aenigmarchaeota archaeon]
MGAHTFQGVFVRAFSAFLLFTIVCAQAAFAESICALELSKESYLEGDDLAAILTIDTENAENESSYFLSYRIEKGGAKSPIFQKSQTLSIKGERTIVIEQKLGLDYPSGKYFFIADVKGPDGEATLEKSFSIGKEGNSTPLVAIALALLAVLTVIAYLKSRKPPTLSQEAQEGLAQGNIYK